MESDLIDQALEEVGEEELGGLAHVVDPHALLRGEGGQARVEGFVEARSRDPVLAVGGGLRRDERCQRAVVDRCTSEAQFTVEAVVLVLAVICGQP